MNARLYGALLHLLPRNRREQYGTEMSTTFAELIAGTRRDRGRLAAGWLWMKEAAGLARFGWRERAARAAERTPVLRNLAGSPLGPIVRDAWRSVRARRGRAMATVTLLGLVLAINTLTFAVADALIFKPVPYPNVDRLIEIRRVTDYGGDNFMSANTLDAWRQQADLFSSVQGYLVKSGVFLIGSGGATEQLTVADVTPGTLELLGVRPRWGRSIAADDAAATGVVPSVVSYETAVKHFGSPAAAIGARLETNTDPLLVIGVMPAGFRFPQGSVALWRAMDPRGPLTRNFAGVSSIALIAPGVTREAVTRAIEQRAPEIGVAVGARQPYAARAGLFSGIERAPKAQVFLILLGAAACLLLTACASVVSMELAGAVTRARRYAIQLALGASRARLAATAISEGAIVVGSAAAAGLLLAWLATSALPALVPLRMDRMADRGIALDGRVLAFMVALVALTWIVTSLPVLLYSSRPKLLALLKIEDRASATSRDGARLRRLLTGLEIALASVLLIGGICCARAYATFLSVDKGFDSRNMISIDLAIPENFYTSPDAMRSLNEDLLGAMRRVTGVAVAVRASAPPGLGSSPMASRLQIDDQARGTEREHVAPVPVELAYFDVLRQPILRGRAFQPDEAATSAIVPDAFARRLAGGIDAVGHRFSISDQGPTYEVIGVVPTLRSGLRSGPVDAKPSYYFFTAQQPAVSVPPPPASAPRPPPRVSNGGSWKFASFIVRVDSPARAKDVLAAARAVDPRLGATVTFVDDAYAETVGDVLLATRVISVLGLAAFVIAIAGVYGVMAFLAAARTREIGVRMALGAGRRDIVRLILGSSAGLVAGGVVAGVIGAIALSKALTTLLAGVALVSVSNYALVTGVVAAAAIVATWQPARRAARTDPAITLRSE